jgi:beta-N-acetylhexosaminidase
MKHIPGHGRATRDSHHDLPQVPAALADLDATDFAPFRALADLPAAMSAHVVYPALDPVRPATLSPELVALIRGRIGFDGLLMTDDLSMKALAGPFGARAHAAIAAGCDMLLHCNGEAGEAAAVAEAAPELAGAALARADRALAARGGAAQADPAALEAEFIELKERSAGA